MKWIKDEEFLRGNIPMTKYEIRTLAIAELSIEKDDVFLDIGAGTGSVSIEAALQGAKVYAIEKEEEGIKLIKANAEKFNVNITTIKDEAIKVINEIENFNKCFVGGSGGKLKEIVNLAYEKLPIHGVMVANFVTLDNMQQFKQILNELNCDVQIRLVQASNVCNKTGIIKANNPVFIVRGIKK